MNNKKLQKLIIEVIAFQVIIATFMLSDKSYHNFILIPMVLGLTVNLTRKLWYRFKYRHWQESEGTVLSATLRRETETNVRGYTPVLRIHCRVRLRYSYEVLGKVYTDTCHLPKKFTRLKADICIKYYEANPSTKVLYDPVDPHLNILCKLVPTPREINYTTISLVSVVISIFVWYLLLENDVIDQFFRRL